MWEEGATINDRGNVFMEPDHSARAHETRLIRIHTYVCMSRGEVAIDQWEYFSCGEWDSDAPSIR